MAATKLFSDFPTTNYPGMVTPNITADIQQTPVSIQDQAAAYALQRKMKADRAADWARAATANRMRQAVSKLYESGGHYLPSTMKQSNPRAYEQLGPPGQSGIKIGGGAFQGPIKYAPSGLTGGALGLWSEQENKRAMRENRRPPMIIQRYADDPTYGQKGVRFR